MKKTPNSKVTNVGETELNRTLTCQEQLDFASAQYKKLADAGAVAIEDGIFDLAIVMGFYGAMPAAACSGSERADDDPQEVVFPWVQFEAARANKKARRQLEQALFDIEASEATVSPSEYDQMCRDYRKVWHQARDPNLKVCHDLLRLLDDFYRVHQAPAYGVQLTVQDLDTDTSILQNIGRDIFSVLSRREQLRLLKQCQQELHEFGCFLQEKFLAGDNGRVRPGKYITNQKFEL